MQLKLCSFQVFVEFAAEVTHMPQSLVSVYCRDPSIDVNTHLDKLCIDGVRERERERERG